MKRSLHVGINNYPGTDNDLAGCVNDANNWRDLAARSYSTLTLLDSQATKGAVVQELENMVAASTYRDTILFTYSGHGSWVPDTDGDEADHRDECLVLYDFADGGLLVDDEFQAILSKRRFGVRAIFIPDSCHSGTVARAASITAPGGWCMPAEVQDVRLRGRFLPPGQFLDGAQLLRAKAVENAPPKPVSRPSAALLSGCQEWEVSYDAMIDGLPQGAFSAAAFEAYRPGITLKKWHAAIALPTPEFPQAPNLSATYLQGRWTL